MASFTLTGLPSLRRQNLLAEFAGLKQACPEGVFVSLTPGDPALWTGVIFVRKGPYAPAILRFQIAFPDTYPSLQPLVTFSTDIFHPLITPLTTYLYTTDIQDGGTVSATDEERLPPGGFSLRHGFPAWFGRGRQRSMQQQRWRQQSPSRTQTPPPRPGGSESLQDTPILTSSVYTSPASVATTTPSYAQTHTVQGLGGGGPDVAPYEVLRYMRSAFDDEAVLDAIPLEAAGNPGAWHAWRTHRRQQGKTFATDAEEGGDDNGGGDGGGDGDDKGPTQAKAAASTSSPATPTARKPGEWNWEHVWEERVKKGISASLSDSVLFGNAGVADDVIRFLSLDDTAIDTIRETLKRTLDMAA